MNDERVDWTVGRRPGVMGGECSACLHVAPLHERGCMSLAHREQPCACARCEELPDGLPVEGRVQQAPRVADLNPDESRDCGWCSEDSGGAACGLCDLCEHLCRCPCDVCGSPTCRGYCDE